MGKLIWDYYGGARADHTSKPQPDPADKNVAYLAASSPRYTFRNANIMARA